MRVSALRSLARLEAEADPRAVEPMLEDRLLRPAALVAIASSDHNVVWAGTGETFSRSNVIVGNGVYKSTDGGESW